MPAAAFRIALLADIHGNDIALDAVLCDIEAQGGADAYWFLGDLVAVGPQPVQVMERIGRTQRASPNVCMARGNTDRYTTTLDRPAPTPVEVQADPQLLTVYAEVAHTFAWTRGCLTATGWYETIDALPLEARLGLPDGTRLLGVHAAPGMDDGHGLHPYLSDECMLRLLDGCNADLVCVGHTHWPMNRRVGAYHVVNVGSVSNPVTPDLQACYALLHADRNGYCVEHRRVAYDRAAVIAAIHAAHHPAGEYIVSILQGKKIRHAWGEPAVWATTQSSE